MMMMMMIMMMMIQHARTFYCMKSEVVHIELSLCTGRLICNNCVALDFFLLLIVHIDLLLLIQLLSPSLSK